MKNWMPEHGQLVRHIESGSWHIWHDYDDWCMNYDQPGYEHRVSGPNGNGLELLLPVPPEDPEELWEVLKKIPGVDEFNDSIGNRWLSFELEYHRWHLGMYYQGKFLDLEDETFCSAHEGNFEARGRDYQKECVLREYMKQATPNKEEVEDETL